jgi:nucleoid-associated protein YgaU
MRVDQCVQLLADNAHGPEHVVLREGDADMNAPDPAADLCDLKVKSSDVYGYWVVKSGDFLSKIARRCCDDGGKYMKIFEANTDVLKDPNVIKPGQKLKIPNLA